MDAVWAGVVGTVLGVAVSGAISLVAPLVLWNVDKKKLEAEHNFQAEHSAVDYKRNLIARWRKGIAEYKILHDEWSRSYEGEEPEAMGTEWFESLRPHLPPEMAKRFYVGKIPELAAHIGKLEKEWKLL